jgi:hypothetical protein
MIYVKTFLKWCLIVGGLIFWFTALVGIITSVDPYERVYDCTIAEISPDFPIEVREECRRLRIVERRTQV